MIVCPRCGSVHLLAHAPIQCIVWRKRRWWGAVVPVGTTVGLQVSCASCMYAFVSKPDGSSEPVAAQAAYDALAAAQKAAAKEKGPASDKEAPKSRPMARPAPDPRVRPR